MSTETIEYLTSRFTIRELLYMYGSDSNIDVLMRDQIYNWMMENGAVSNVELVDGEWTPVVTFNE